MSYQLANAKVWNGSAWVDAAGGGKAGQDLIIGYASDFASSAPFWTAAGAINVTADVSAHTKGAWTQLVASTGYEASAFVFSASVQQNATATAAVIEFAIGASGSEVALCEVAVGSHSGTGVTGYTVLVPVRVPQGSRVSARLQSVQTGGKVAATQISFIPQIGAFASASTVDVYGVNLATSRGTAVAASASMGTFGAWTELASTTSRAYRSLVVVFSASNDTMGNVSQIGQVGSGASGSEVTLGSTRIRTSTAELFSTDANILPFLYVGDVPAGTRLAVRHTASVSYIDACVIGVPYP